MNPKEPTRAFLFRRGFRADPDPNNPGHLIVTCEKCRSRWRVPDEPHLGNTLYFIDHAASHEGGK